MIDEKVWVVEDDALRQEVSLQSLVDIRINEGYVETSRHQHPAVGTVVVMRHKSFMDKGLTHRDYLEKMKRRT